MLSSSTITVIYERVAEVITTFDKCKVSTTNMDIFLHSNICEVFHNNIKITCAIGKSN
jgi:hypothetical protein